MENSKQISSGVLTVPINYRRLNQIQTIDVSEDQPVSILNNEHISSNSNDSRSSLSNQNNFQIILGDDKTIIVSSVQPIIINMPTNTGNQHPIILNNNQSYQQLSTNLNDLQQMFTIQTAKESISRSSSLQVPTISIKNDKNEHQSLVNNQIIDFEEKIKCYRIDDSKALETYEISSDDSENEIEFLGIEHLTKVTSVDVIKEGQKRRESTLGRLEKKQQENNLKLNKFCQNHSKILTREDHITKEPRQKINIAQFLKSHKKGTNNVFLKKDQSTRPFSQLCSICGSIFKCKKQFEAHIRKYSYNLNERKGDTNEQFSDSAGAKRHECNISGKKFEASYLQRDSEIRKYKCTICKKDFAQNSDLVNHKNHEHILSL